MSYFISHCHIHLTYGRHSISFCWFSEHMKTAIISMYLLFISFSKICCYTFSDKKKTKNKHYSLALLWLTLKREKTYPYFQIIHNSLIKNNKWGILSAQQKLFYKGEESRNISRWIRGRRSWKMLISIFWHTISNRIDLLSHTYVSSPFPSQLLWIAR